MSKLKNKWWLGIIVVFCLVPAAFADRDKCDPHDRGQDKHCQQQVPEGGSAAIYLLGAGLTCFGAMYLRSKTAMPTQS
jgi:hypothetical protein